MQSLNSKRIASLNKVSKKFGDKQVLKDIDLDICAGEVLSILGPNGAGKTTLINLMLGRYSLSTGNISIFGYSPGNIHLKRLCGAMLQISGLPDMSTIKEQIQLFSSYYPQPMTYQQIMALTGLKEIENQFCKSLSGGQKQRLLFALSICGNPQLLFLDEPSAGMDISMRKSLWKTITNLKQQGTSIILTTHYLEEADQLSDRIVILNQGKIIQRGTPDEIKTSFNCKKIKFISALPIDKFKQLDNKIKVEYSGKYYKILSKDSTATIKKILALTDDISDLTITGAALEDAFLSINQARA
jgi:ABC-2 type transport system ATP-binding protein